jgi:hypothetical protein
MKNDMAFQLMALIGVGIIIVLILAAQAALIKVMERALPTLIGG